MRAMQRNMLRFGRRPPAAKDIVLATDVCRRINCEEGRDQTSADGGVLLQLEPLERRQRVSPVQGGGLDEVSVATECDDAYAYVRRLCFDESRCGGLRGCKAGRR